MFPHYLLLFRLHVWLRAMHVMRMAWGTTLYLCICVPCSTRPVVKVEASLLLPDSVNRSLPLCSENGQRAVCVSARLCFNVTGRRLDGRISKSALKHFFFCSSTCWKSAIVTIIKQCNFRAMCACVFAEHVIWTTYSMTKRLFSHRKGVLWPVG